VQQGKRLPPENLLLVAENSMAMAARYQPERTRDDGAKEHNPEHNEERYAFWLNRAREALRDAAPYYAPRLHAVAVQNMPSEQGPRADPRQIREINTPSHAQRFVGG
jgi:hypothetical protein